MRRCATARGPMLVVREWLDADTTETTAVNRDDFGFIHMLRVRWSEVDMQGVVFNGHYLNFADVAFTEYWRATGLPDVTAQAKAGQELFVRKATLEYLAPARFDDQLTLGVRCRALGRSSMTIEVGMFQEARPLAAVELIYVYADTAARKSVPLPAAWRAALTAIDAGAQAASSKVRVEVMDWDAARSWARAVRTAVFVVEQGIPIEREQDAMDPLCLHAMAFDAAGQPIGTGRLLPDGHIGRMAVLAPSRQMGVGGQLLGSLIAAARGRGDCTVRLAAQQTAERFYRRHGFEPDGAQFIEVGLVHIPMRLHLV